VALSPHDVTKARLARFRLAAVAAGLAIAWATAAASTGCSETGPDAPGRKNGCIVGVDCAPVADPAARNPDGGPAEAPIVYGDPLAGTTKEATLIRGRFRFTEGPVWVGNRLLFTDPPANLIYETLGDGGIGQFRANSGAANGLAADPSGNLIACEGGRRRVTRSPATRGAPTSSIASTFAEQPLNAPNDVVVRADGNIYFTDPNYSAEPNTQDDEAVYRIDPAQKLTRLAHDFVKPNGIALAPDGATLYVVDNGAGTLLRAPVDSAGAVGAFTELAPAPGGDGMAVDDANNLYVTRPSGACPSARAAPVPGRRSGPAGSPAAWRAVAPAGGSPNAGAVRNRHWRSGGRAHAARARPN
jgi:gluconolactonase